MKFNNLYEIYIWDSVRMFVESMKTAVGFAEYFLFFDFPQTTSP